MFFIKFFYFLKGYVIIGIEGLFIERFINICVHRGIKLHSLSKREKNSACLSLSYKDFCSLRPIAYKTKSRVRIIKKCGLPHLIKKYRKRYAFFAGAALFILFFAVSSCFVWSVEINGADHLPLTSVAEVLRNEGIYEGAPKMRMSSAREVKDSLMRSFENISWAWIYIDGCRARIEINEGTLPPAIVDKGTPCDIVAMRDGIIDKVTVKEGRALSEQGRTVMAGDVIIAGTMENSLVHALGDVYAVTWHEKKGIYNLYNEYRIPTGRKSVKYTLNFFSKTLDWGKNSFSEYDTVQRLWEAKLTDRYYLGIGLMRTDYIEIEPYTEPISEDSAVAFAEYDLEKKIADELLPGAAVRNRETILRKIDDRTLEVTLTMEFIEKIGTERIIYTDGDAKNDTTTNGN